jgi:hypothetical protein
MKNLLKREFNNQEKSRKERVQRSPARVSFPEVASVLLAIIRLLSKVRVLKTHSTAKRIGEGYRTARPCLLVLRGGRFM